METSPARTVYIVDDDDAVRDSLRALLGFHGITVKDFNSARAFLDAVIATCGGCLLLDINMPDMDGLELFELIRSRGDQIPVILMTGRDDPGVAERVKRAGALAYLLKPLDYTDLFSALDLAFLR